MAQIVPDHQAHMRIVVVTVAGEGQVLPGSHAGCHAGRHRTVHIKIQI